MEILITERTDITPLLGMDWMKKFKLTISKIQLAENNQSEREKVFNKFPDLFENNETIKDTEINIQLKPGHYPVKRKGRPIPLPTTPPRRCRTGTRKTNKIRTLRKNKRCRRRLFCITGGHDSKKRQVGENSAKFKETERQLP